MANIKSAKKDIKRTRKVTENNHELKARVRNNIKNVDKAVAAGDEKKMKESKTNFIKRLIAAILVFLVVTITQFVLNAVESIGASSAGSARDCLTSIISGS